MTGQKIRGVLLAVTLAVGCETRQPKKQLEGLRAENADLKGEIGEEGEVRGKPGWMRDIQRKLKRSVSFEFVDTPLSEAVCFFQALTKINMILDSGAVKKRGNTPITLKVGNEPMGDVFDRILEIARFDYALIDEAMFISTRERLACELERQAALARAEAALEGEGEPEWKREIRRKLARKVAFEFVDTPMQEAIRFLQTLTRTTIILDPKAIEGRGVTPITLRVNDMPLSLALRWILRLAGLDYTFRGQAIWISTPENVLAELGRRAEPQAGRERPEWEREFRKLLQRKVSFEFVDAPLSETILFLQTLSKCRMILDPRAVDARGNPPIDLKVTDMSLELALDWILRLADLEYTFKDGAIFISTRERLARESERDAAIARAERAAGSEKEPEWKRDIRRKFARKVTFEFVDTPLDEAVQFLQAQAKVSFIFAPREVEERRKAPITLRAQDMTLRLALRWILKLAGLDYTIRDRAVWITTPENVLAELRRRAKPEVEKPMLEWEEVFRQKLQRKVSFEFVDTPLSETLQFLQTLCKCSMILDPRAVEERGNTPVNLRVADMSLELALDWIVRLAGLEYALKDGAVFISTPEIIARERDQGLIPGSPTKTPPEVEEVF